MPASEMDSVYSIGTRNRFNMIDNDITDDPLDLILAAQEKPKKEKEPKTKGKKDVKTTKATEKKTVKIETPSENENSENKRNERPRSDRGRGGRGGGRGRGRGGDRGGRGRGGSRGGFSPSSPSTQDGFGFDNNNQPSRGFGKFQSSTEVGDGSGSGFGFGGDNEERRGGRSGFRGGRGRGGRGRGRGGNREFDRRSGSDKSSVKAVDKRDGSGSYNWGTPQDEINAASEEHTGGFGAPKEATDETPVENTEQAQDTEETQVEEIKDEGPQEMTFEEYKKQQSEQRKKPQYVERKVENENKKGMKQLKKPTEEENEQSGSLFFPSKKIIETYKTSGREKNALNVDFRYGAGENRHLDSSRRARGSGGRSGRKSGQGGGRKEDSSNAKEPPIALSSNEDFPSLQNKTC